MVRWRKQNVRAPRCRLNNNESSDEAGRGRSEGEEGDSSRPNLSANATTSLNSRKRVRLHGKVSSFCPFSFSRLLLLICLYVADL